MADVVAGVLTDVTAARRFDGRPSHLDYLLAKLGDTHYPASGERLAGPGAGCG
jgi:hypothetical protein